MECDSARLLEFVNGNLTGAEMEETLDHLDTCRACSRTLQEILAAKALRPEIEQRLPADFFPAGTGRFGTRRLTVTLAVAASILVAAVAGLYILKSRLASPLPPDVAAALEDAPFAWVSSVNRGAPSPAEGGLEALMEVYTRAEYPSFLERAGRWLESHPQDWRTRFYCGVAAYLTGRYESARGFLESAAAAPEAAGQPEVDWYLANVLVRRQDTSRATALLEKVVRGENVPLAKRAASLLAALRHAGQ